MFMSKIVTFIVTLVVFPAVAHAYIGPGTGLSAIGSIAAFIGSILLLLIGFIWYPLKRLFNKNSSKSKNGKESI